MLQSPIWLRSLSEADTARRACCRPDRADRRYTSSRRPFRECRADPHRSCRRWRRLQLCRRSVSTRQMSRSWCDRRCGGDPRWPAARRECPAACHRTPLPCRDRWSRS
ncbi:MAG: hypothetical protein J0I29_02690 [Rhizobiales bacterium]|nr:hypothetical protein [Hyphomicrobiales bacterium]